MYKEKRRSRRRKDMYVLHMNKIHEKKIYIFIWRDGFVD